MTNGCLASLEETHKRPFISIRICQVLHNPLVLQIPVHQGACCTNSHQFPTKESHMTNVCVATLEEAKVPHSSRPVCQACGDKVLVASGQRHCNTHSGCYLHISMTKCHGHCGGSFQFISAGYDPADKPDRWIDVASISMPPFCFAFQRMPTCSCMNHV